jgi:hypothetical protein
MLETIIVVILVIVFWNPIFMNTIGPFIIWKTQKIPTDINFVPVDESKFISERNEIFRSYDKSLSESGFSNIGSSLMMDSHSTGHFRLYWNNENTIAAMVVNMVSKVEDITYLEVTQKYEDGVVIDVNNSPVPESYPKMDFKLVFRYPKLHSADEMVKILQNIKSQTKPGSTPVSISGGFKEVSEFIRKESDELLRLGMVKNEIDETGKRSLTLKGAFAMTFRSVPPGRRIRAYLSEKNARKFSESV